MNATYMRNSLKSRRIKQKLTQEALAARLQTLGLVIDQRRVSDIESGKARLTWEMLPYFAAALQCTPNDLVLWEYFSREAFRN